MSIDRSVPRPGFATALGALAALAMVGFAAIGDNAADPAAAPSTDPASQTAEVLPRAGDSLILDLAASGERRIGVGERGHVLLSDDGTTWRQAAAVPTRSTLTGVSVVGDRAWAVGHDGVILGSTDRGETWTRLRLAPYDPTSDALHNGAPLLDVLFLDEQTGFALGAFALLLRTDDGGATWREVPLGEAESIDAIDAEALAADAAEPAPAAPAADAAAGEDAGDAGSWTFDDSELDLGEESDPHLNAIARTGDGALMIVAERGAAYRSVDAGATWERLRLPYQGSMFGVLGFDDRHVLAFGMRGTVLESRDLGDTWSAVETGTTLSLMGGAAIGDGGAVLVGANGAVLTRTGSGTGFLKHVHPDGAVLATVLPLDRSGTLITAGEQGLSTYLPN